MEKNRNKTTTKMIPLVIFINSYHPAFLNSLDSFLIALDETAPQGQKEAVVLKKGPSKFSIWESSKGNRVDWDPVNNYPDGEFTEPTPYGDIDKKVRTALPFFLRIASLGSRSNPLVHTKVDAANVLYHIPVEQLEYITDVYSVHKEMKELKDKQLLSAPAAKASLSTVSSSKVESGDENEEEFDDFD
jgi:hypothetical protein